MRWYKWPESLKHSDQTTKSKDLQSSQAEIKNKTSFSTEDFVEILKMCRNQTAPVELLKFILKNQFDYFHNNEHLEEHIAYDRTVQPVLLNAVESLIVSVNFTLDNNEFVQIQNLPQNPVILLIKSITDICVKTHNLAQENYRVKNSIDQEHLLEEEEFTNSLQ